MSSRLMLAVSFIQLLTYNVLFGHNAEAQMNAVIHLEQHMRLKQVFRVIEKETSFRFIYDAGRVDVNRRISMAGQENTVADILNALSSQMNMVFRIINNTVTVKQGPVPPAGGREPAMPNPPPGNIQELQQLQVNGTVTDKKTGKPLPGVAVTIKGTSAGTITDENGRYSLAITNASDDAVLVFSFMGYKKLEVPLRQRSLLNAVLEEDPKALEEVVVVGYGTQKKVNLTGAVSTISGEALASRPVANVGQALQGISPGLNITQSGEQAGSLGNRPSINVRGIGTIGQGSKGTPLILIDGMEGDINALSPQDIDNISVLKDAAASSIYGSRAPFGVILVTTKKGKPGKAVINANASYRSSSAVLLPRIMDSYTFATYFNDARLNSGQGVYFTDERLQRIKDYMDGKIKTTIIPRPGQENIWADGYFEGNDNVDWYRAIYKAQAPSQEYSLSASGGTNNITYYVAGSYLDMTGLMRFGGDHFERYNTTAKIDGRLSKIASFTYIGRFSREDFERPSNMTNTLNRNIASQGWPVLPLYDNNGFLYDAPSPALGLRDGGRDRRQTDRTSQQLKLTLEPLAGWKVMGDVNYSIGNFFKHWDLQKTFNHDVAGKPYPVKTNSEVHEEAARENYLNTNLYTEYTRAFGPHNFKVLAGMQSELMKTRSLLAERQGIIVPTLPVIDATSGNDYNGNAVPPAVAGDNQHWSTVGYFGRLNYDYKGRYLLEGNIRYDGSSRFRANKRWIYSPSASIGWNIWQENFWKPVEKYVNTWKIRASYGELSNQNTSSWYPTYVTMPVGSSNGAWLVNGARPNTASAPKLISSTLTWEKVSTWNIGTDISFFRNRLTAAFDIFTRYTNNMIGPAPELPVILGTTVPSANNTNLKTSGFELDINWKDQLGNGLGYNVHLLLSDSKTEITRYPNPTGKLDTYLAGHMAGEIWGYKTIGIAKTQEEMDAHLASLPNGGQNALGSNWKAGDLMYEDVNKDGKINNGANTIGDHGDLVLIGNSTPRYLVALDLGANFRGFDLRAFFQGVLKRDYFQNSYYFWGASTTIYQSAGLTEHVNYFRDDPKHPLGLNLDAYYPRPLLSNKNQRVQTKYLQHASYLRLKNLQLGYTIAPSLTRRIGVQRVRAYVSGENIWTITKMAKMFDPETIDGGWGGSVYPLSKVYSLGLSITL